MFNEMDTLKTPYIDWKRFSFIKVAEGRRPSIRIAEDIKDEPVYAELQKLISECWDSNPKNRPDAAALVARLEGVVRDEINPEVPKVGPKSRIESSIKSRRTSNAVRPN